MARGSATNGATPGLACNGGKAGRSGSSRRLDPQYGQRFEDSVALQAVNEVESVTSGLSAKIGQKLMILYTVHGQNRDR